MLCTMPFSFKVIWSPIVEFYHFPWVGKRKSWIIPMQLIMGGILMWLSTNLEQMLVAKQVWEVMGLLTFFVFIVTC